MNYIAAKKILKLNQPLVKANGIPSAFFRVCFKSHNILNQFNFFE